jgi:hypothetical protein
MRNWNSSSRTSTPPVTLTCLTGPMRYVVLDTDVASRAIKDELGDPMAARLTGTAWCVTFVTVGELWQWATIDRTRPSPSPSSSLGGIKTSRPELPLAP